MNKKLITCLRQIVLVMLLMHATISAEPVMPVGKAIYAAAAVGCAALSIGLLSSQQVRQSLAMLFRKKSSRSGAGNAWGATAVFSSMALTAVMALLWARYKQDVLLEEPAAIEEAQETPKPAVADVEAQTEPILVPSSRSVGVAVGSQTDGEEWSHASCDDESLADSGTGLGDEAGSEGEDAEPGESPEEKARKEEERREKVAAAKVKRLQKAQEAQACIALFDRLCKGSREQQQRNTFFEDWHATAAGAKACVGNQPDKYCKGLLNEVKSKIKVVQGLLARHASPGSKSVEEALTRVKFQLPEGGFRSIGLDIRKRVMVHYVGKTRREARYDGSQFLAAILYGLMSFEANMAYQ